MDKQTLEKANKIVERINTLTDFVEYLRQNIKLDPDGKVMIAFFGKNAEYIRIPTAYQNINQNTKSYFEHMESVSKEIENLQNQLDKL